MNNHNQKMNNIIKNCSVLSKKTEIDEVLSHQQIEPKQYEDKEIEPKQYEDKERGTCCFCGDDCNPYSQSCGYCSRQLSNFR
jgi:hypothetical protein